MNQPPVVVNGETETIHFVDADTKYRNDVNLGFV